MGGAFTAMTGDAAACPYYNPAGLMLMKGSTLSASVSTFNKYETQIGATDEFNRAPLRLNQGSIVPLPNSSGYTINMGVMALGLSILVPDNDDYNGEILGAAQTTSYLKLKDQSLWLGGSLAWETSKTTQLGLSIYYTSRTLSESLSYFSNVAGSEKLSAEDRIVSQNSLVYILGLLHTLNANWRTGLSIRLPSLPIHGKGSYAFREVDFSGSSQVSSINESNLKSTFKIPPKISLGLAWESSKLSVSFDLQHTLSESFYDLSLLEGARRVHHKPTWNLNFGIETKLETWLALRMGLFTNLSTQPKVAEKPSERASDHIDMLGLSANFALATSPNSQISLGGSYIGGKGSSAQEYNSQWTRVSKTLQVFSFLVGTNYSF